MRDQPITEWTAHIETPPETALDDDALGLFHDAINADPIALGPSAMLDLSSSSLSSSFQVLAETPLEAASIALEAFERALRAAGLPTWRARAIADAGVGLVELEGPRVEIEPVSVTESRETVRA